MQPTPSGLPAESIEHLILTIRGQRVILDADLARLYGVPTFRFNEAFKRNRERFPDDFAFQLSREEFVRLTSQSAASNGDALQRQRIDSNSSQFAMSSRKHRGAAYRPWAFTEHGALMAANILRASKARQMSVFVIRAFVLMREQLATNAAILKRLVEIDQTLLVHDAALRDLYAKLRPLLLPPRPKRREIGFHAGPENLITPKPDG